MSYCSMTIVNPKNCCVTWHIASPNGNTIKIITLELGNRHCVPWQVWHCRGTTGQLRMLRNWKLLMDCIGFPYKGIMNGNFEGGKLASLCRNVIMTSTKLFYLQIFKSKMLLLIQILFLRNRITSSCLTIFKSSLGQIVSFSLFLFFFLCWS